MDLQTKQMWDQWIAENGGSVGGPSQPTGNLLGLPPELQGGSPNIYAPTGMRTPQQPLMGAADQGDGTGTENYAQYLARVYGQAPTSGVNWQQGGMDLLPTGMDASGKVVQPWKDGNNLASLLDPAAVYNDPTYGQYTQQENIQRTGSDWNWLESNVLSNPAVYAAVMGGMALAPAMAGGTAATTGGTSAANMTAMEELMASGMTQEAATAVLGEAAVGTLGAGAAGVVAGGAGSGAAGSTGVAGAGTAGGALGGAGTAGAVASGGGLLNAVTGTTGQKIAGALAGGLLGSVGGSKESGKITTTTEPWAEQKPYLTDLFARSKAAMDGSQAPSSSEMTALNQLNRTATGQNRNPMLGMDNPYLSKTIQTAQDDVTRNMQGQFNTASRQSGSFGNSGLNSEFAREMPKALGNIDTTMRMQDYTNQQGLYENAANRELSASKDLYTMGQNNRYTPFNNLEKYGRLIQGSYGGSSSQPYFTNPTADILGGMMTGYNFFNGSK